MINEEYPSYTLIKGFKPMGNTFNFRLSIGVSIIL
jgi:hypothetical protein